MTSFVAWFLAEFRKMFGVSGCQNPSVNKRLPICLPPSASFYVNTAWVDVANLHIIIFLSKYLIK